MLSLLSPLDYTLWSNHSNMLKIPILPNTMITSFTGQLTADTVPILLNSFLGIFSLIGSKRRKIMTLCLEPAMQVMVVCLAGI